MANRFAKYAEQAPTENRFAKYKPEPSPSPAKQKARADAEKRSRATPGAVRAAAQGPTISFADELDAASAALETGANNLVRRITGRPSVGYGMRDAYEAVMQTEREQRNLFAKEHPVANVMLPMAAGLMTPGAGAASRFVSGARTMAGTVARSAAVGAGFGAVAGAGAGEGVEGRAKGALAGGVVGGAIGGAVPVAARAASNIFRAPVDETTAMQQATEALQEAGVDVRSVSTATMDRIRMQVRQGRDAREAALGIVANNELPVPLPMTRGQRSGDPGQQLSENMMLRGARGSAASRQMRGFVDEQQQALRGNVDAIGSQISGGAVPQRGVGGEAVSGRLNALRDTAEEGVNNAYSAARQSASGANLPPGESFTLAARMREAVRPHATERTAGGVFDEINALARDRGATMQDIQATRSRLVALQGASDGQVRHAATQAKNALDAYLQEGVERGFIQGDEAGLWGAAIGARREMGRTFEAGDLVDKITARNIDGTPRIDPASAANEILSRSDMGFVGRRNLYRDITKVRGLLGADSAEWHALRGEVFQRLASQGEAGVEFGQRQFSGVKFQKAWQDFVRKDPRLANTMFSDAERAQINRFATLAARVTNPVKGGDNSSNTAVTAMRLLGNLKFLRGLPFLKDITNEIEVQVNLNQARAATSGVAARAARPAQTPNGPLTAGAVNIFSPAAGRGTSEALQ